MEPRNQECYGLFGYGNGYYAREGKLSARLNHREIPAFCDRCPSKQSCWEEHRRRVKAAHPDEVAAFEKLVADHPGQGGAIAVRLLQAGTPDPAMAGLLDNFKQGISDREGK